jgi:oxygen-independent coproporphyrinogen-3 oxidase
LEKYVAGSPLQGTEISQATALEESFFLGLRLNRGVDLHSIAERFGRQVVEDLRSAIAELVESGLLQPAADRIRLTARGRLLSNEVFQAFLAPVTSPIRA